MNVLFILPEYYPHSGGGISTYYLHYIKALRPHCKKIKVLVGSGYLQRDEQYTLDGVEIEYLKTDLFGKYLTKFTKFDLLPELKRNLTAAWAMFDQVRQGEGFDLVECTDFGLGFIPWIINHNKPIISRLHGSTGQIYLHETKQHDNIAIDLVRQTELQLLPACDRLITHSYANQNFWNKMFDNDSVVKIDPIFISTVKKPLPLINREEYGLVTARIQEWKGPLQLCEAVSKMNAMDIPQLKWFGRDMNFHGGQSMADFLNAAYPSIWNSIILPQKPLDNKQIHQLQQNARFGIVPSTWDMFNFTCLEFLGAGTPLICSDGAGASDLINHGINGFKYSAMDTRELAECIKTVSNLDEGQYHKIALSGIETIKTQLSPSKLIPVNLTEYKAATTNFSPRPANQFLDAIYRPSDKEYHVSDILDTLPLKRLINYISKRMKTKIGTRK